MDLIQGYSSESDQETDHEEQIKEDRSNTNTLIPPPLPPIVIYSQSQQSSMNKPNYITNYISIHWNPSHSQLRQIDIASRHIINRFPSLNHNYNWVPLRNDLQRNTQYHISLGDSFHYLKSTHQQKLNVFKSDLQKLTIPSGLIKSIGCTDESNPLGQLLNSKRLCINLKLNSFLSIYPGKLPTILFIALSLDLNHDTRKLFKSLANMKNQINQDNNEDESWLDHLHISITTGYQKRKILKLEEIEKLREEMKKIDLSDYLNDIDINVEDIEIQSTGQKLNQSNVFKLVNRENT